MEPSTTADEKHSKTVTGYPAVAMTGYRHNASPQTGYATVPYKGYPSRYPSYPNTVPPSSACHQGGPYYTTANQHHHLPILMHAEQGNESAFGNYMLYIMIMILTASLAMAFVTYMVFGTETPAFLVDQVTVPTFKISNSSVKAVFIVNVSIVNPTNKLEISFHSLECIMLYKDISVAKRILVQPFQLGGKENGNLLTKLKSNSSGAQGVGAMAAHDMTADLKSNRKITFALKMVMDATFTSGSMWRREPVSVYCSNLLVAFNSSGFGNLAKNDPIDCLIYA